MARRMLLSASFLITGGATAIGFPAGLVDYSSAPPENYVSTCTGGGISAGGWCSFLYGVVKGGDRFGWAIDYGEYPGDGLGRVSANTLNNHFPLGPLPIGFWGQSINILASRQTEAGGEVEVRLGFAEGAARADGFRLRVTQPSGARWQLTDGSIALHIPTDRATFDFTVEEGWWDPRWPTLSAEIGFGRDTTWVNAYAQIGMEEFGLATQFSVDADFEHASALLSGWFGHADFGFAPKVSAGLELSVGAFDLSLSGELGRDDFGLGTPTRAPEADFGIDMALGDIELGFGFHYDRGAVGLAILQQHGFNADIQIPFERMELTVGGNIGLNSAQWQRSFSTSIGGTLRGLGNYPYADDLVPGTYWQTFGEAVLEQNDTHQTTFGIGYASGPQAFDGVIEAWLEHRVRPLANEHVTFGSQLWFMRGFDGAGHPVTALGGGLGLNISICSGRLNSCPGGNALNGLLGL